MTATASSNSQKKEPNMTEKDVAVIFGGKQIILPEGMNYDEGIEWIKRKQKEEETVVSISEKVHAFPLDGAVALTKVLKERYGWTRLVPTPGFFDSEPPAMIGVQVGPNDTIQVPWGNFKIPGIDGTLQTHWTKDEGRPIFQLIGNVKRKHEKEVKKIADEIRQTVKKESIYRGQAIRINFRDGQGERMTEFRADFTPRFIDTSKVRPDELIYTKDTEDMVRVTLFNPVEHTQRCRKNGIPLKRGVLLEGPFGTGKTLTAHVLSLKCVQNGWTFLYLEDVRDLDLAMLFARLYQPCVIFAEDVDRAMGGSRNSNVDRLLNTLDGVDSKHHDVMVVLTTNNKEIINPAFVRPGRIDAVIPVLPPDALVTVKLVRNYGKNSSGEPIIRATDEELALAIEPLVGANAAFIREAVERAKLAAVSNDCGEDNSLVIDSAAVGIAAKSMAAHLKLLDTSKDLPPMNGMEFAGTIMCDQVGQSILRTLLSPQAISKVMIPLMKRETEQVG